MYFYKTITTLSSLVEDLSSITYSSDMFDQTGREKMYRENLDLNLSFLNKEAKEYIDTIIKKHITLSNYSFSIIESSSNCNVHKDAQESKERKYQRYANLAIPLVGDMTNRYTVWPNLTTEDTEFVNTNGYLSKDASQKYYNLPQAKAHYKHKLYTPVLLNTEEPHTVLCDSYSLFVYITLIGVPFKTSELLFGQLAK